MASTPIYQRVLRQYFYNFFPHYSLIIINIRIIIKMEPKIKTFLIDAINVYSNSSYSLSSLLLGAKCFCSGFFALLLANPKFSSSASLYSSISLFLRSNSSSLSPYDPEPEVLFLPTTPTPRRHPFFAACYYLRRSSSANRAASSFSHYIYAFIFSMLSSYSSRIYLITMIGV